MSPKFAILYIVSTTVELINVIINTPKKLKIAAIIIAFFGFIDLVETQVAMAFGASVHPFTNITPKINTETKNKIGFSINPINIITKS